MSIPAWYNPSRIIHNNYSFVRIHDVHIDIEDAHQLFEWYHAKNLSIVNVKCHQPTDDFVYDLEEEIDIHQDIMQFFTSDLHIRPLKSLEFANIDLTYMSKVMLREALKSNQTITKLNFSLNDMIFHIADMILENNIIVDLRLRGIYTHMSLDELTALVSALIQSNNIRYLDISENNWQLEHMPQITRLIANTNTIFELVLYQPEEFFCCQTADQVNDFASALRQNKILVFIHLTNEYSEDVKNVLSLVLSDRHETNETETSSQTFQQAAVQLKLYIRAGHLITDTVNVIKTFARNRTSLIILPDIFSH